MDYNKLLDFTVDLGYELSMCGAETYRVEESITHIFAAYGIQAEVFAIPNNLIVSIIRPDGKPTTRMRRIGFHGNDLDSLERFSDLGRQICRETPDADTAAQLLEETIRGKRFHSLPLTLLGYFLGAAGFALFFGGRLADALSSGISAIVVCMISRFMSKYKVNTFFSTLLASIPLAFIPYFFGAVGLSSNPNAAIIGAVMVLVPGLLFINAIRDIIFGDINSGINRIIQVLMIAVAIACGTAVALKLSTALWSLPTGVGDATPPLAVECIGCILGCIGFSIIFNIHGPGMVLCILGGVAALGVYRLVTVLGLGEMTAMLIASSAASIYAEVMARVRKCPAIGYLIIGLIILIPGSSLYYTIYSLILGNADLFADFGMKTLKLAGLMAAGILLVSTTVRLWANWKYHRKLRPSPKSRFSGNQT